MAFSKEHEKSAAACRLCFAVSSLKHKRATCMVMVEAPGAEPRKLLEKAARAEGKGIHSRMEIKISVLHSIAGLEIAVGAMGSNSCAGDIFHHPPDRFSGCRLWHPEQSCQKETPSNRGTRQNPAQTGPKTQSSSDRQKTVAAQAPAAPLNQFH